MPSERDLAARFDANRGAIRESLKKLEQLGIACITPGGVRVVPVEEASLAVLGPIVDLQDAPDPVMAEHLLEVLGALLSMAARTAMARASDEQLAEMQSISADILDHNNNSEYQSQRWRELGTLFTRVSNNLVLRLILNGLETQLLSRAQTRPQVEFQVDTVKRQAVLQRLNNAIQARDGQEAAAAIIEHFELLNRYLQLALQPALEAKSSPSL